ncbi:MAG: hypothetical protein JNL34_17100 [Anaerolineae bacterium]|nr:hypothetical protein [Anaerolineae bacterium]
MSVDPAEFQENEEKFQRQLARIGWALPLLTFISLLSFGALLYILSQMPEVDSVFPAGFLLGLAGGFISTAVIFYFYEYVFAKRMEKRALFSRQSAVRRRYAAVSLRQNTAWERWEVCLGALNQLSQGNLPAFQPRTRAAAQAIVDALNAALTALTEYDDVEEERAAVVRDFMRIKAEDGSKADVENVLETLLRLAKERRERRLISGQLWAEVQRLSPLLATLPEAEASTGQ